MNVSLIITVLNEEATIELLLDAVEKQTFKPTELIITDAGSTDKTISIIQAFIKRSNISTTLLIEKGNRSLGRNKAIAASQYSWIAITDAGCIPRNTWLEQLITCQQQSQAEIVAGNQVGLANSSFQKAVVPYVLIMQDKINEREYLPATRSVLLAKKVWNELHGFDEKLIVSEDYAFFKKAQKNNYKIVFCRNAVIEWLPRKSLKSFYLMINSFAIGDSFAHLIRPKIYFLFFRYFILALFLILFLLTHNYRIIVIIVLGSFCYLLWSISKNGKYVDDGWKWLPILQLSADVAVMTGTLKGLLLRQIKRLP